MTSWQRIQDLPTPALLLDWPVAHRNIKTMASLVERTEARLRPHCARTSRVTNALRLPTSNWPPVTVSA